MTTLGQAYVQIMPSAKGISGSIQKTINPEATAAGKSAGRNIASSMADSLGRAGKTLTKAITVPVLGATTAIGGIVAAMGWSRLTGIDTAQAKLKGLGHDAKSVETIMDSALDSVRGTSYGLDEAATSAAGAVAAGIKPGKDLTRYLSLSGDAAAIAGSSMGEMGSIFGKVQTAQKAYTGELNQLADRGIPIFQWLAEEAGTTAEGVREMASEGSISSEMFLKAIENNIGGAAKTMGEESFTAGIANIGAAIGRLGAEFLDAGGEGEGFFSTLKPMIGDMIGFIDNLAVNAADLGVKFGEAFTNIVDKIVSVVQWWTALDGSTKKLIFTIAGIAVAIGPVLLILSKVITTALALSKGFALLKIGAGIVSAALGAISAPVLIVTGVIAGLIALFTTLYQSNEGFRDSVLTVWETIRETMMTVIQTITNFVMEIWGSLVTWWNENNQMILLATQNVWSFISTIITTVMNVIWGIMQVLWPVIQALIVTTWEAIKGVIQGAIGVITGIIQFFSALFTGNWSAMWGAVKQIVSGAVQFVWNFIQVSFVGRIVKAGATLAKSLTGTIKSMWETIRIAFMYAVDFVKGIVTRGFGAIRNTVTTIMGAVRGVISSIWNGIRSTISNVVNSIRSTISNIFNSLRGIVSSAFSGVTGAVRTGIGNAYKAVTGKVSDFFKAGGNIVGSIADGIKGAVGKVTGAISNITQKIRDFLPFSPPKTGPLIDIMDVKWGETISGGIIKGEDEVAQAMDDILNFNLTKKAKFNDPQNNKSNNKRDDLSSQQNQPIILQVDGKTFAQITGDYTSQEGGNRIRRIERGLAT